MTHNEKLRNLLKTLESGILCYVEFYQTRETEHEKREALRLLSEAMHEYECYAQGLAPDVD